MAESKRKKAFREKVEAGKAYDISEALGLVKELATAKFPESIDVSVNLGVDPRKSDQNVRGSTVLPNGTGKTVRVAVFAQSENAEKALAAGADVVGMDDLHDRIKEGDLAWDVVIATPDAMRVVGKLGQVLGTRGEHQQELCVLSHTRMTMPQQQCSQILAQRRAARFTGHQ